MENAAFASGAGMAVFPVQAYPGGTMRVLAVEEDPACLTALTEMLQRHGYQVTAKASPEEGLRALQENLEGFDLVMTVVRTQGPGIDGFEFLKHAAQRYPVILFSGVEPAETKMRGMLEGACAFLTKPLRDKEVRDVWQHVVARRRLNAASGADARGSNVVVVRQDETVAKKRGLDDSGEGGSDGRTAKKNRLNSWSEAELHAAFVKAVEQLRGTEGYCPRGIQDLLEAQGVQVTIEQVLSRLKQYIRDCITKHLSAKLKASSSHSNISKNYSTPGSSGFYMRPHGTTNIYQTSPLSNGASPAGCDILGKESYRASHAGLLYNNGNFHGNANGVFVSGSMVSASLPSNLAQQVHQTIPEDNGNGNGNGHDGILAANGNMVSASLPSNLAQPVQKAMPTNTLSPSGVISTMDIPNPIGQQAFPRVSRLRYDSSTGGISMLPWPVDDGEELLRSYLEDDNELMQTMASTGKTRGMHGYGTAGQNSASQPQDLNELLNLESSNGNGSGVVTDGILDCDFSEMEKFFDWQQETH